MKSDDHESISVPYVINRTVVKLPDLANSTGYADRPKSLSKKN